MATSSNNAQAGITPVPTLSTQGLIYDSANKFDTLLSHILVADVNQSYLYQGHVRSLAGAIQKGSGDRIALEQSLTMLFQNYFARYYEEVTVETKVTAHEDSTQLLDFEIIINVTEGGQQAQFGRLIRTANQRLSEIIRLNNYGG